MNLLNKIIAFFKINNEEMEMEVSKAEIREGKAFLHPKNEKWLTYIIPADDISITLNNRYMLTEDHVTVLDTSVKEGQKNSKKEKGLILEKDKKNPNKNTSTQPQQKKPGTEKNEQGAIRRLNVAELSKYKRKKFTIQLYPDEYEQITSTIKTYGFKREEFVLACINKANKRTVAAECKRIKKNHVQIKNEVNAIMQKQSVHKEQNTQNAMN